MSKAIDGTRSCTGRVSRSADAGTPSASAGEFHARKVSVGGMDVGIGTERSDDEFTPEEARPARARKTTALL